MRCRLAGEEDLVKWHNPSWNREKSVAGLTSTQQKITEDNDVADSDAMGGVTTAENLVGESTEVVNNLNVQNIGNLDGDWEEGIYVMYKVQVVDENGDQHGIDDEQSMKEQKGNDAGHGTDGQHGTPSDNCLAAPILNAASSIELKVGVSESRMSSTAGGSGCEISDERLDDQEPISQMMFAEEPNWQLLMDCSLADSSTFSGVEVPVANVDGVAHSANPATEVVNGENIQNNENRKEEIDIICKVEVMDADDDQQDDNANGIGNPHEGTSSDEPWPEALILEPVSPIEYHDENDEELMPSLIAENGSGGVNQGAKKYQAAIPIPILIKMEKICQSEGKGNNSSEEGSSKPLKSAKKQNKRSRKRKSSATAKSSTLGLNPFVSLERLSSADILKEKLALKRNKSNSKFPSPKKKIEANSKPRWSRGRGKGQGVGSKPGLNCPHCPRTFHTKSRLTSHIRSHTIKRPFHCPHCPEAKATAGSLRTHIRKFHPEEDQNLHPCRTCQERFPNQGSLMVHVKKHWSCYFCSKKFSGVISMWDHLVTHTREKAFKCPHGRYRTPRKHNLESHIRRKHKNSQQPLTHPQEGCGSRKKIRKNKLPGKFLCDFCPYTTNHSGDRNKHMRIHTGKKPFKCPHCPYAATITGNLKEHLERRHRK